MQLFPPRSELAVPHWAGITKSRQLKKKNPVVQVKLLSVHDVYLPPHPEYSGALGSQISNEQRRCMHLDKMSIGTVGL